MKEKVIVIINGNDIKFGNTMYGAVLANLQGMKLSYNGVVREFPDLKDNPLWRELAIERFNEKIKSLPTEEQKSDYIVSDLRGHGYVPKLKQVGGFRPIRIQ